MKPKRTLIKTIWLMLVRYNRWRSNPANVEKMMVIEKTQTL